MCSSVPQQEGHSLLEIAVNVMIYPIDEIIFHVV